MSTKELSVQLADSELGKKIRGLMLMKLGPGQQCYDELDRIFGLVGRHPYHVVEESIRRSIKANEPRFAFVMKQLFSYNNELAPKYNFCTAGRTAIEINANGDYSRCIRHSSKKNYLGNIINDQGIKILDLSTDAGCNLPCKKRMCFARNTIRSETRKEFDAAIDEKGLRGDYRYSRGERPSDIFIRWNLTEICNYKCSYCSAWKTVNKKGPELAIDEVMKTAELFTNQFDNISLRLTGGEPAVKKNFEELMHYLNTRLDKFVEIEVRTNFSFKEKQQAVFDMDWDNKLHYHIGCHVYDRNFRPWEFVEVLSQPSNVDYVLKFVSSASNQQYVDIFHRYFIDHGIDPERILIVHDVRDSPEDHSRVPPAYLTLKSRGKSQDIQLAFSPS